MDTKANKENNRTSKTLRWYSNWDAYKHQDPGKYVCQAKKRHDGSIEERIWWINRTNFIDELKVERVTREKVLTRSKGDEVEFKVHFYGKSPWTINWLNKDGDEIGWADLTFNCM